MNRHSIHFFSVYLLSRSPLIGIEMVPVIAEQYSKSWELLVKHVSFSSTSYEKDDLVDQR